MNRNYKKYNINLLIIFVLIVFFTIQNNKIQAQYPRIDSSKVEVRMPPFSKINEYKNNPDFIYDRKIIEPPGFWDRLKYWLIKKFFDLFNDSPVSLLVRYLVFFFLIFILVLILIKGDLRGIFFGVKKKNTLNYDIEEENIHAIKFDEEISKAVNANNYRLAVRYLFLKSLKELTDNELIDWRAHKTNNDYLRELKKIRKDLDLTSVSYVYEYIWYGHFSIDKKEYETIAETFNKFYKQI